MSAKQPSIWYGCPVRVDALGDAAATQAALDRFVAQWFPGRAPAEHRAHATVLYHGSAGAVALRDAELATKSEYRQPMAGTVARVEKHVGHDGRHYVTLSFDCDGDALQHLHARLRAEAEARAGAPSRQAPHVAPAGRAPYVNGVNPHITIAVYAAERAAEADAEFVAAQAGNAFAALVGLRVTLLPLEEHFSAPQ